MTSRKCKSLTLAQRLEVIKCVENNRTQASVALEFGVSQSVISRILKKKENIVKDWQNNSNPSQKRKRGGKAKDVEEALLQWFAQARSRPIPINGPLLLEKANQLANDSGLHDFKATSGWLERWKLRNGIQFKRQHGEKPDAVDFGAERWLIDVLPEILKDYHPKDIFNADETGLYWRALPHGTLSFIGAETPECKTAEDRLTILLACNMDGSEKLDALVIGNSKSPKCFKNLKKLPAQYEASQNAWMTTEIWQSWLKCVDNQMCLQKRSIIILCDNCAAHGGGIKLSNVKIVFLPPNTTSLIQPMNQGIIANFKKFYRSLVIRKLFTDIDGSSLEERASNMTVLDALHMIRNAWSNVTQSTIANCYRQASFFLPSNNVSLHDPTYISEIPFETLHCMNEEEFKQYVAIDDGLQTEGEIDDSTIVVDAIEIKQENDERSDDDNAVDDHVTSKVAIQSLQNIRRFMEQRECELFEPFYEIESTIHQLIHTDMINYQFLY
ncbi:hypothetical protein ACJMK2_009493 [Sinanodonta woodiana]|uniref:Tigger transposable element-derived protein 4 n=1 Tax=Sinanodonta woodiana TaxID=1069815 RepID=A0ABD3VCF1_SINWO